MPDQILYKHSFWLSSGGNQRKNLAPEDRFTACQMTLQERLRSDEIEGKGSHLIQLVSYAYSLLSLNLALM